MDHVLPLNIAAPCLREVIVIIASLPWTVFPILLPNFDNQINCCCGVEGIKPRTVEYNARMMPLEQ